MEGSTPPPSIRTESQGNFLIGIAVGFVAASALLMSLRLYSRIAVLRITGVDDWTMFAALCLSIALSVSTCMEAAHGMGRHVESVSKEDNAALLDYLYVNIILYNIGMNLVKISFLFQYRRIFQSRLMQRICLWAMIYVAIWTCTQIALLGVACLPISFIVPSTASWCLDTLPIWYFSSAMSLATDILIFCIPMPSVLKLQLARRQKILVFGIFCLGFFVCIISVYRMFTLHNSVITPDPTWDNVGTAAWSVVELNTAIICSSLPTLRPLLARVIPGLSSSAPSHSAYQRYDSKWDRSMSGSQHQSSFNRPKASPRSISTEEIGLIGTPSGQAVPPAVVTRCSVDKELATAGASRRQEMDADRQIRVTTQTSVKYRN